MTKKAHAKTSRKPARNDAQEHRPVKSLRLESLNHVIEIGTTLSRSWFRGHSRPVNQLIPRLFRSFYQDSIFQTFRPDYEVSTIEEFKRHAATVSEREVPHEGDRFGWLCLMQHYRMPTRLLDWTENPLVALYLCTIALASSNVAMFLVLDALTQYLGLDLSPELEPLKSKSRTDPYALTEEPARVKET